jgi:ABC-type multidrug transport system fused ATPase/permease subunit
VRTLSRLVLTYIVPHWWALGSCALLIATITALRMAPAWLTQLVIDEVIPSGDWKRLALMVLGVFGSALALNSLTSVQTYLGQMLGQRVLFDLRGDVYKHLQSQSMSFFDENQTGQLMSRVTNDVGMIQFFITGALIPTLNVALMIGLNLAAMTSIDLTLTLLTISVAPLIVLIQMQASTVMPMWRKIQQRMADLSTILQENIAAIKLVKAFTREDYEVERFNTVLRDVRGMRLETARNMQIFMQAMVLATSFSQVLAICFGALRVIEGDMTIGQLFAFQSYALLLWLPTQQLGFINMISQQAIAGSERVFAIVDTPLDVAEKPGAIELRPMRGEVAFEDVSFAYANGEPLLRNISFSLSPGRTLAIVGPSGSGKSTIINLVPRFYDPTQGRVLIDGHDVRDLTLESLRSQIGMVMQETFLFNMTVRENIKYGRADASDDEMIAAAKAANAHDFIAEMPEGYDTMIGEKGVRLSGGQRQRISIARAIVVNPRILILDEATSAVDTRTDYLIQQALDRLMEGRTTFVIAHRLTTAQRADEILVLADGRVVARGSHGELLETSPQYRTIYETQLRPAEEARAQATPVGVPAD